MSRSDSTEIQIMIAHETASTELAAARLVLGTARAGRAPARETVAPVPEQLLRLRTMILPITGPEIY